AASTEDIAASTENIAASTENKIVLEKASRAGRSAPNVKFREVLSCRIPSTHGACSANWGFQHQIGPKPHKGAFRFAPRPATIPSGPPRPESTEGLETRGSPKRATRRIVKAGLKGLNAAELVGKSTHVENEMTGNVSFASPSPDLTEVNAARTALVAAIAAA